MYDDDDDGRGVHSDGSTAGIIEGGNLPGKTGSERSNLRFKSYFSYAKKKASTSFFDLVTMMGSATTYVPYLQEQARQLRERIVGPSGVFSHLMYTTFILSVNIIDPWRNIPALQEYFKPDMEAYRERLGLVENLIAQITPEQAASLVSEAA